VRVAWEGSQTGLHSLALVNRALCARLAHLGHELSLWPLEFAPELGVPELPPPPELAGLFRRPLSGPAEVTVRHRWPPDFRPPAAGHWVTIQPWEFGSLPRAWAAPLIEQVDEVWAYTRHVRDCYVDSGVPAERVRVVPLGVDTQTFRPGLLPLPLRTGKRFKFLFVGGTLWRKGFDILLAAYGRAFRTCDDVCLVIKEMGKGTFYRGQTGEDHLAQLRQQPDAPEVEYIEPPLSAEALAGLYAACDCLVLPYRGEGFGLPIAEAMACGLPVIVTGLGAALDFCNDSNAYLVPARRVYLAQKRIGDLDTVDHPWLAEPDLDALVDRLRHVARRPADARTRADAGCAHIRGHFTWDHAAAAADHALRELWQRPLHRSERGTSRLACPPTPGPDGQTGRLVPARRARFSLCMIVRNEENNLLDCVAPVLDLFDEVVINDTGSTDRTREIARSLGPKVKLIESTWPDSFAAARNLSLDHASGDWIFWLDADDRVDRDNHDKLATLFASLGHENLAFSLKCFCVPDPHNPAGTYVDHIRLFRNHPQVRWEYRVHEQILPAVRRQGGGVREAEVVITHVGYQTRHCAPASWCGTRRWCAGTWKTRPTSRFACSTWARSFRSKANTPRPCPCCAGAWLARARATRSSASSMP
jgi:glycosyltransferase involved in cell wall biosynthesis